MQELTCRQVAWLTVTQSNTTGPKYLYKRGNLASVWSRATNSKNREAEFALYQTLRRQGYVLVNRDGTPMLDEKGAVIGDKPLPPATSTATMEDVQVALDKVTAMDMTSVQDGEVPITRLLTLEQRIALMKFTESLTDLPRELLMGYTLQVALHTQTCSNRVTPDPSIPEWLQPAMSICDPTDLGHIISGLAKADKDELISLLKEGLPEVMRLQGIRGLKGLFSSGNNATP
jgi:hypothetical protein